MRRLATVIVSGVLSVLILAVAAQATVAPQVRIELGSTYINGAGWGLSKELKATLKAADGAVKGACWVMTSTAGDFSCNWGQSFFAPAGIALPPALNEPGDSLTVEHEGETYVSGAFANTEITAIDPAADRVAGRVTPRRATAIVESFPRARLTPTGFQYPTDISVTGTTAADGAFSIDLTAAGDLLRNDMLFVGYVSGRFKVGKSHGVPGLVLQKDGNAGILSGVAGKTYLVRLYAPGGALKAEVRVTPGRGISGPAAPTAAPEQKGIGPGGGYFVFVTAAGNPVRILEGDKFVVTGPSGFQFVVPKLAPSFSATAFKVRTLPNKAVMMQTVLFTSPTSSTYANVFGKTDATGLLTYTPAAAVNPYSRNMALIQVGGNEVNASRVLGP